MSELALQRPEPIHDLLTTVAPPKFYLAVLQYFTTRSTEVATVEELEEFLNDHVPDADRRSTIHLHHSTLPKLATVGLLDYDPRTHTVRYRGDEAVESWIGRAVAPAGVVE